MNEIFSTTLEVKQKELDTLSDHIDSLYDLSYKIQNQIEDAEEKQASLEQEVAELKMRVKAGDLGEYGYSLLFLQGKNEEEKHRNFEGYGICRDKFIICNTYLLVALNERPPLLEENKEFSMNEEYCLSQFNITPKETVEGKPISEYEDVTETFWKDSRYIKKPPYEVLKIGTAYVQKKFVDAVWRVLGVDEKATVQTYAYGARGTFQRRPTYSLYVSTDKGSAVLMGVMPSRS